MKNFFLVKILRWGVSKIDGYKTKLTGLAIFLHALSGAIGILNPNIIIPYHLPIMTPEQVYIEFTGAMGVWGIGGKLEKAKKVTVEKNLEN